MTKKSDNPVSEIPEQAPKTMGNTTTEQAKQNTPDLKVFGDPDGWKLIAKVSSESEGYMKSTKAMQIDGAGCLVQVSEQQRNPDGTYSLATALTYAELTKIIETKDSEGNVVKRRIVDLDYQPKK